MELITGITLGKRWGLHIAALLMVACTVSSTMSCTGFGIDHSRSQVAPVVVENVGKFAFPGWIKAVAFSDKGETLLVGGCMAADSDEPGPCGRGIIQVWKRNKPKPDSLSFPKTVTSLTVSPGGKEWIAGDEEGRLISSLHKNVPRPFHQKGKITALAFSPDGKWVVSGSLDPSFPLGFLDPETGGVVKVKIDFDPVSALAFSPDGKDLAVGTNKGEVLIWEYLTPKSEPIEVNPGDMVEMITSVTFSPDGRFLAYGTSGGKVMVLKRGSWQLLRVRDGGSSVKALLFSPDSRHLAVAHDNGRVVLLDSEGASPVWTKRHVMPVLNLAYSPDGKSLAVAAQGTVFLYSVNSVKEEQVTTLR